MSTEQELTGLEIPIPAHIGGSYPKGDANTWMPDIWGYLTLRYNVRNVLDIGCGWGYTIKWFADIGLHAIGIDGDPNCVEGTKVKGRIFLHDFTQGEVPASIIKPTDYFDLGWSAEFLEHVEEKFIANYMAAFRRCNYVVVTHAIPGQIGHNHVNCQDDHYWVHRFAEAGFIHMPEETDRFRATNRYGASWGRPTLMMFHRI